MPIPVGWLGVGTGGNSNNMRGNDLALCWPNATGNGAIISQRSANSNTSPTPSASIAFNVQQAKSGLSSSNFDFTCTFSRPLDLSVAPIASTASSINVIYAVGLQPVKDAENGDPQQAAIQQHTYTGHGVLAIQRKSGLSSDPNNTISIPQSNGGSSILGQVFADDKIYEKLVQAHGYLMSIAFLLLFPTGAILVRFFSHIYDIFKLHRPIQVTGFLCVLAGFGCILGAVYKNPAGPTLIGSSNHATLGVIIFTALVMQISYGIYIYHTYNPSVEVQKTRHRVLTWVHRLWGYSVLIAAVVQIALGLSQYGLWPTRKEGIWYAFYVVVAFWVVLFLIGSAVKFLRRPKGESVDESCKDDDVN
ncbi:S-methyl-5-thioribose-1-phosphate isomerase [Entomortierella chlamydospora]|nr:S-methyl-5-thioribose-1-phosphate isomerase [Entomortierella chlamydospora]